MRNFIFIFVFLLLIIFGLYAYFIMGNQLRTARGYSKGGDYVSKMYQDYGIAGQNCQGEDSDGDGYITCNFRLKENKTSVEKTIILQCPTFIKSFMATSCKEQGILFNQN